MGDYSDMLCDACIFDKGCIPVSLATLARFRHLCKNAPDETPCKWYDEAWAKAWKDFYSSVENIPSEVQALHNSKGGETDMSEDSKKTVSKDEKPPESMVETGLRILKKDYNWKIFAGMILGWIAKSYIGW